MYSICITVSNGQLKLDTASWCWWRKDVGCILLELNLVLHGFLLCFAGLSSWPTVWHGPRAWIFTGELCQRCLLTRLAAACNSQVFFILWGFANALLLGRDSKHRYVDTLVLKLEAFTLLHDVRIGSWNRASLEILIKNALSKSKVLWRDTTQRGWWIAFAKSLPGGTEHHCSTADFHGFHAKLCAWHSGKWAPWAAKVGLFPASKFVSLHLC